MYASMGPHSTECGNVRLRDGSYRLTHVLQWGRTQLSAEMRVQPRATPAAPSFNGAALN